MPVYEYEDKKGNVEQIYVPTYKQRDSVKDKKRVISSDIKIATNTHIPDAFDDYKKSARSAECKGWKPTDRKGKPYSRKQIQSAMNYHEAQCRFKGEKRLVLS